MNILKAVDLQKIYGQGETEVRALDGVNLEVEKGEFVAIVGLLGVESLRCSISLVDWIIQHPGR